MKTNVDIMRGNASTTHYTIELTRFNLPHMKFGENILFRKVKTKQNVGGWNSINEMKLYIILLSASY
jgi:hypothetical protein